MEETCPYEVKPLPYEFCALCIFNGCYPWNRNPFLLCSSMGGLMPCIIVTTESVQECSSYRQVDASMWDTHLTDLMKEAELNEECRRRARDGKVKSNCLLPAEYVESLKKKP